MVTDKERLIAGLSDIYDRTNVEYEPAKLRDSINQAAKGLFGKLEEFVSYPRVYFIAKDADFDAHPDLPSGAVLKGDVRLHAGTCWQRCIGNCLRGRLEQIDAPSEFGEAP